MNVFKRKSTYFIFVVAIIVFYYVGSYLNGISDRKIDYMEVILTAIVPKDDTFQLFYLESSETQFKIPNSVRAKITGSNTFQEIKFRLPKIYDLSQLRLDIGENFEQGPVEIKSIKFLTENGMHNFDLGKFNKLFSPNKYIETPKESTSFIGSKAKIGERLIYDPGFYSNVNSMEFNLIKSNRLTEHPFAISGFIVLVFVFFILTNIDKVSITLGSIFVSVFAIILILPIIQKEFQLVAPLKNLEKRELAKKPNFSFTTDFAQEYESYFNDNFGFRNHLVNWGGNFRTKLFRASMHPELVVFGKDKWLFYNRLEGRIYRSYSRTNLLTPDTLKMVVNKWELNRIHFEKDSAKYVLAFWPNKQSIYPEYMPNSLKLQIKDTVSRVDQIENYIKTNKSSINLTDVRDVLLKEKKNNQLYHKFDSHWNSYGAFLAYQEFFNKNIGDIGINPKTLDDFEIKWENYNQGELIQMLGIQNQDFFIEKNPVFTLREDKGQIEYLPTDGYPRLTVITKNEHCGNKLRALIFRDSFSNSLIQFISLHFHEVYYIWGFNEEYVKKLKPDIILDGFVEREIGEKIR